MQLLWLGNSAELVLLCVSHSILTYSQQLSLGGTLIISNEENNFLKKTLKINAQKVFNAKQSCWLSIAYIHA